MKELTMMRKWIGCSVALWTSLVAVLGATPLSSATSGKMMIDTRAHKAVMTFGRYWPTQAVRYSGYAWDTRFASEAAEVTADGVTLVKAADEGQMMWRPARVGLHTLHHIAHGGTLTRTYYAEGPMVRIVCTQTGTAGSMLCQIDCDMPGATIYYTTDGTEPTTASRVYTGPFQATLPKVKRLLAVAVVDGYPMSQTAYPIISIIEDVSVVSSATSGKMVVDTRAGKGPIATDQAEDVTYSNLWSGDASATATVAVNGDIVKTATVEGVYRWPLPSKGGNYVLTHQTMKNGTQVGETLTATFVVASHEIEIDDGTGGSGGKESRFSSSGVYDGKGHGISVEVTSVANPRIAYSLAKTGPYVGNLLLTNACDATAIWYTVAASGYNTYTNWATVTIAPRDIALVTVAPIADQDFAGAAVEPVPAVTDGEPSIVTADDYTVSYADNAASGTATLTLTGRGNYAGTKAVTFVILSAARDVVFDALGGRIGSAVAVTQSLARVYGDLPTATRAGYVLDGWFLGVTNGAPQAVRGAELLADAGHALYARWSPDPAAASDPETLYAWEATGAATARILGLRDPNVRLAQLILPDRIGGLFVTEIAASAFANTTCGATALALPVFCTAVGDKAFYNATTLASVAFADARRWDSPAAAAEVAVGRYAFSSCLGLSEVTLAESVSSLGDYAFLNCRKLRKIVVLGRPDVGRQAFRSAGLDGAGGVEVLIDQALADDADYMARLKAGVPSVTVRTDAIVTALRTAALAVSGRTVRLAVAVERAAAWGAVDASALRVEYWAQFGDAPAVLTPRAVVRGADGSLTLEVEAPEGDSGFFRVRMGE